MNKKEILKISHLSTKEVLKYLKSHLKGLSSDEVKKRQQLYGFNLIKQNNNSSVIKKFIKQFTSIFAILLWLSGFLALLIKEYPVGIAIISVVIVNGIFSFLQERKADKILSFLNNMIPKKIQVYRDNKIEIINTTDLTIGDVIFLDIGITVPADARIIEDNNFFIDNSMLSGESVPLNRNSKPNIEKKQIISEIPNLVYAGTTVSQGSAKAVIYSIGENTQIGEVSFLAHNINKGVNTLEKKIHNFTKNISIIALCLSLIVFIVCFWRYYYGSYKNNSFSVLKDVLKPSIIVSLGMLVANIPEGLLPTINLSLAIGSQRMAKQKALIKKLFSVETLNSVTVICTDKTGTLTENQLTCRKILFPGGFVDISGNGFQKKGIFKNFNKKNHNKILNKIFIASIICSEANLVDDPNFKDSHKIIGNPTEGSILIAAVKYGLNIQKVRNNFSIEKIIPFSSETKKMDVYAKNIFQEKYYDINDQYLFIKGAPSVILKDCYFQYKNEKVIPFTQEEKKFFIEKNEELSHQGYRILAITYKKIEQKKHNDKNNMVFLAFFVHYDPPKIEVRNSVKLLLKAGLKITVITGDYGPTAISIGKKVGIIKDKFLNIDGTELEEMNQHKLQNILKTKLPIFFSRTTPKHKLRIVEAYRSNQEIVGVIGDGVNDILAMKASHIGISMGKTGKDVARNSSDMILLDDNFSTIPKAVLEARGIYSNIKKFMFYVLSSNVPQFFPIILMAFFRIPLYLNVMQILAIDLITDLLPAIALGGEEPESNLLEQTPIKEKDNLLDTKLLKRSYGFLGLIEGILALIFFLLHGGLCFFNQKISLKEISLNEHFLFASTMAFGAVIFSQIGNVFACRSEKLYFWQTWNKKNKLLYIGVFSELILFILISQNVIFLNNFFGTVKIGFFNYLSLSLCIFLMLLFDTIFKFCNNNKKINEK
ncbi:HAD ATPase, P-type, IC family protein [Candidatus Phytoplasma oryzae]|uniref:ATPase n=1 Tax=Candidatus Phytoplasma oryzae TaxID=203274 RepID=A0A139JQQ2_9MOLU|nr:cation-transporting P-type ATPase [Candidatus Phytoplasma oryzae]KXT29174.1 HAD ATPase, P-type, IC family protein [Candidatus Phytoplasma oryzae]RAM58055.1 ATPase [Candidatus Phytoplasma oryzae]